MASSSKKVLTTYLRRLTNLSAGNRSLFLPKLTKDQFIDVHEFSQLNGEKSFSIIEALITQSKKSICAVADARLEAVNHASQKLKRLHRTDQFIFEERGSKDLHVGWPIVEGKFNDGTLVRCPLLFFPVELKIESSKWTIHPRYDSPTQFNKSFLLSYAFYNQVKADEPLLEETFDDSDQDSTVFKTQLYHLLQKSSLDINFNPDNYRDELIPFQPIKKEEFDQSHANGKLKLFPQAVIGIFPQAGSYLVPDYLQLLENPNFKDLEDLFRKSSSSAATPTDLNFLGEIKEDRVYPVFPMDLWQENALKGAKLGHSLVVQGPPGTGKSQLIGNLISECMAHGRRVLVVCQKRAALDVVYQRLQEEGLSDFIALVHDFKNDRKEIFEKMARQINRVDEFRSKNNSLDSIYLERTFLQSSRRIDQLTEELEEFRSALFDEKESGKSIKELYLHSSPEKPSINLKQELAHLHYHQVDDVIRRLQSYAHYAIRFSEEQHPWFDRKSFSSLSISHLSKIKEYLTEIPEIFRQVKFQLDNLIGHTLDLDQCLELMENENEMIELVTLAEKSESYRYWQRMMDESEEETSALWLSNIERIIKDCFEGVGPEVSISSAQLGQFQEALSRSLKARRSLIGLVRWELFSQDKFLIQRALVSNGLENNKQGFLQLEYKLDCRLNLEHNLSKLRSKEWLQDLPQTYNFDDFKKWFGHQLLAIHSKEVLLSIRGLQSLIPPQHHTQSDFLKKVKGLLEILQTLKVKHTQWKDLFTHTQLKALTTSDDRWRELLLSIQRDFDAICEFDRLQESLTETEKSIFNKLHEKNNDWNFQPLRELFLNSLALAWIEHLENKHPELRKVSSGQLALQESELREQIIIKQKISTDILLLKARESVITDLEFNRLNNRVTYRDLLHQVTKKKKIWPIRKVIQEFEPEIFKLLPCWLASPESVSALFPLKESFDLVIFDEASQCYAERGIPSFYRARQAVVAGDSQQLRPGDFYQARWEDEDDDHPDQEVDSLLELSTRYWPTLYLKGHYRSEATELIEFSNQHFYDGKLQVLPAFKFDRSKPAIEYRQVAGLWENNSNAIEAEAVARCIDELDTADSTLTIGVVTFNAIQQELILDVSEEYFNRNQKALPDHLFVKNIENVQGDERDVIIFSIGYAPDKSGTIRAQFGSLNVAGGENRLNVAITRARKKIIIITSIAPHQLNVGETKNPGPKLLKEYLLFAKNISEGRTQAKSTQPFHHREAWYLRNKVISWAKDRWPSHRVQDSTMPVFDLSVHHEKGEPRGALLLDDEMYYQSLSTKGPHGLAPILLEGKGWPFIRAHSRNYWIDPEKFFNEISKLFIATD